MGRKRLYKLLSKALRRWWDCGTFQMGAALSYYAVFSIPPILTIALFVAGALFGEEAARGQLSDRLKETLGPAVAKAIETTIGYAQTSGGGVLATIISVIVLLFAAIGLFSQLQSSLNTIWNVMPGPNSTWWSAIRDRLLSFVGVILIAVLLLLSLAANAVLSAVSGWLSTMVSLPGGIPLWEVLRWVVSLALLTVLFALLYKFLPDVRIRWKAVWVGAVVTSALFALGNFLIGFYLGRSSVTSAYGAAGSLVIVLLWVYYSSQVVLLGAVFTRVYASDLGDYIVPAENAIPMTVEDRLRVGSPDPEDLKRLRERTSRTA
jgi:membrane protein